MVKSLKIDVPSEEVQASWTRLEDVQEYLVSQKVVADDPDAIDGAVFEICMRYFRTQVFAQDYRRRKAARDRALLKLAKEHGLTVD